MKSSLISLVFSGLLAASASAQVSPADVKAEALRHAAVGAGSPGEAGLARTGVEAVLEGASDDSTATARVGIRLSDESVVDLVIASPLDKNADVTSVASVSKRPLASDAHFSVGVSKIFSRWSVDQQKAETACDKIKAQQLGDCFTFNPKLPDALKNELRHAYDIKTSYIVGARLLVGHSSFSFKPTETQDKATEDHTTPLGAIAGLGALLPNNLFVAVEAGGEHLWKGQDSHTFCTPVAAASAALTCEELGVGAPAPAHGAVVILKAQRFFSHLAVAANYQYRGAKPLNQFELPIYFLTDPDKGGWTGGFIFRVQNGDPTYAVFVGPTLPYFDLGLRK